MEGAHQHTGAGSAASARRWACLIGFIHVVPTFSDAMDVMELTSTLYAGKDVIGLAQTGSGKTGAFAMPILQVSANDSFLYA